MEIHTNMEKTHSWKYQYIILLKIYILLFIILLLLYGVIIIY